METDDLIQTDDEVVFQQRSSSPINQQLKSNKNNFILEPAVFLMAIAFSLTGVVFVNEVIYQGCVFILNQEDEDCRQLGAENVTEEIERLEEMIQPYASKIQMTRTMVESFLPAILSFFIGPWSDKFGRKPVLLCSLFGFFISNVLMTIFCFVSVNPWVFMLAFIPVALSGGVCALMIAIFSYVSDVTDESKRAAKMGILTAALFLGTLIGTLSGSYIYIATDSGSVFAIASILLFLSFTYVIIFVDESVNQTEGNGFAFKHLLKWQHLMEVFSTCCKKRPNNARLILWLLISSLSLIIFAGDGPNNIFYLFVREKFDWQITEFTYFIAAVVVIQIIGNLIGVYILNQYFGIEELPLILMSCFSAIASAVIIALARFSWHLYVAAGFSLLMGLMGSTFRAVMASVVAPNDVGKVYSLITSIEVLSPVAAAPLFAIIYNRTFETYPGAFNLINAGFYGLGFILILVVYILRKRQPSIAYMSVNSS